MAGTQGQWYHYQRALRLAQRHTRSAGRLAAAMDRLEDADDLTAAHRLLVDVADGQLDRRGAGRTRGQTVC